eukprot:s536_g10.t1
MKIGAGGLRVAAPSSRLGPAGSADLESTIKDYLEAPADDEEKGQVKVAGTIAGAEKKGPGELPRMEEERGVWIGGEGTQLPVELVGPRMMVQLKDRAAQLVKHLSIADVNGIDGKEVIFREC